MATASATTTESANKVDHKPGSEIERRRDRLVFIDPSGDSYLEGEILERQLFESGSKGPWERVSHFHFSRGHFAELTGARNRAAARARVKARQFVFVPDSSPISQFVEAELDRRSGSVTLDMQTCEKIAQGAGDCRTIEFNALRFSSSSKCLSFFDALGWLEAGPGAKRALATGNAAAVRAHRLTVHLLPSLVSNDVNARTANADLAR